MKRALTRTTDAIYYYVGDPRVAGAHDKISGDVTWLSGNVSGLSGNVSGIVGDVSGLRGDVSGLRGDVSGLSGYIDDCGLTDVDRAAGVNIDDLTLE